jgi:hypothetical protein
MSFANTEQYYKTKNNKNNKAIINNINQYKILNIIDIIHKKRLFNHIKKFIIWMI